MTEMFFEACLVGWFTKSVWMMLGGSFLEQVMYDTHNTNRPMYIYLEPK